MAQVFCDENIAKWLEWQGPCVEDQPSNDPNYSWGGYTPCGEIQPLNFSVLVPSFSIAPSINDCPVSYIAAQFNFIAPAPFTLLDFPFAGFQNKNFYICVRYRIGAAVFRYVLTNQASTGVLGLEGGNILGLEGLQGIALNYSQNEIFLPGTPRYSGQVIEPNFVIEIWALPNQPTTVPISNTQNVRMKTSIIIMPTIETDTGADIVDALTTALFTTLPLTMPFNWDPSGPWLSN